MNRMDVKEANVLMRHGSEDERSGTEAAWGQRLTNIGTGTLRYGLVFLEALPVSSSSSLRSRFSSPPQGRWPRDQMSGDS
jgi:hypothetical protein